MHNQAIDNTQESTMHQAHYTPAREIYQPRDKIADAALACAIGVGLAWALAAWWC